MLGGLAVALFRPGLVEAAPHCTPCGAKTPGCSCNDRSGRIGIVGAFADEYGRVLHDRSAFGLIVLAPDHLWLVLPAALSRTADQGHSRRHRRRRHFGRQPHDHPGRRCRRGREGGASTDDAGGSASRARPARGVRHPEHSGRNRARGPERQQGEAACLCQFRLFPALQPDAPGHSGRRRRGQGGSRGAQRPPGWQPLPSRASRAARRWRS